MPTYVQTYIDTLLTCVSRTCTLDASQGVFQDRKDLSGPRKALLLDQGCLLALDEAATSMAVTESIVLFGDARHSFFYVASSTVHCGWHSVLA